MAQQYHIDAAAYTERLDRMYQSWQASRAQGWNGAEVVVIMAGKIGGSTNAAASTSDQQTLALHSWLLGYEFPETVMIFSQNSLDVITNKKKTEILQQLLDAAPAQCGVKLRTHEIERMKKQLDDSDETQQHNESIMNKLIVDVIGTRSVGVIEQERAAAAQDSTVVQLWLRCLQRANGSGSSVDVSRGLYATLAVKTAQELELIKKASEYSAAVMDRFFLNQQFESIVEDNKRVSHADIALRVEEIIQDPLKSSSKTLRKMKDEDIDVSCAPTVQSCSRQGGFDLAHDADAARVNTSDVLDSGIVACELGAKYKSYNSRIGRTYIVNGSKRQERAYRALAALHDHVCGSLLLAGSTLSQVYQGARDFVDKPENEAIKSHLGGVLGWGIGLMAHEHYLELSSRNSGAADVVLQPGMVFVLRLTAENMTDADSKKRKNYGLLICNTVAVQASPQPAAVLTSASPYAYDEVSYTIDDEQEDADDDVEMVGASAPGPNARSGKRGNAAAAAAAAEDDAYDLDGDVEMLPSDNVRTTRTRTKLNAAGGAAAAADSAVMTEDKRQEKIDQIIEEKRVQWGNRDEDDDDEARRGGAGASGKKATSVEERLARGDVKSYAKVFDLEVNPNSFNNHQRKRIVIDEDRETLLLPIGNSYIPLHISTIKSISKSDEGTSGVLRINFKSQGIQYGKEYAPAREFPSSVFLKEVSYRARDPKNIAMIHATINDMKKRLTQREKEVNEKRSLVAQEKLVRTAKTSGKPIPRLRDVHMRPAPKGKKTVGVLDAHENGLLFQSSTGDLVEIIYANIRYAFFQPAKNDPSIIIHFRLFNEIMVGKKKVKDVQFMTTVIEEADHLVGNRQRRNLSDREAMEEEERERKLKAKLNQTFEDFCRNVEKKLPDDQYYFEFESPDRELEFVGTPGKESVMVAPTTSCLISLTEYPAFVLPLDDVELVRFERVSHGMKNCDMKFVFKDYTKPVAEITSIPISKLDMLKDFLLGKKIVYFEGRDPLNWKKVLETVREAEEFKELGPWDPEHGWTSFLDLNRGDDEEEDDEDEMEDEYRPSDDEGDDDHDHDDEDGGRRRGGSGGGGGGGAADSDDEDYDAHVESEDDDDDFDDEGDDDDDFDDDDEGEDWDELDRKALEEEKDRKRKGKAWSDDETSDLSDEDEDSRPAKKKSKVGAAGTAQKSGGGGGGGVKRR